jgi:hypothetical protein
MDENKVGMPGANGGDVKEDGGEGVDAYHGAFSVRDQLKTLTAKCPC